MPAKTMTMFSRLSLAVAVGFVGAYPFASASGLIPGVLDHRDSAVALTVFSGIILFFLTIGLIGPVGRLVQRTLDALGRVEERPGTPATLAMLTLGTLCAISAMIIQYNAGRGTEAGVSMNLGGLALGANPRLAVQSSGSFVLGVLTLATFFLGASLVGLGIWASLKPVPATTARAIKPEVPELDEVRA